MVTEDSIDLYMYDKPALGLRPEPFYPFNPERQGKYLKVGGGRAILRQIYNM